MQKLIDFLSNPLVLTLLVPLVGGLIGTVLEALGERFRLPLLVAVGQRIEALLADLPKAIRGSRKTAAEKDEAAGSKPPSVPPGAGAAVGLVAFAVFALVACSSVPKEEQAPCRIADYGILAATCGDDPDECNRIIEEREKFCAEKIRSGK